METAQKRASALRKTIPRPDGVIAQGDRQHVTWNYAGILASPIVIVTLIPLRRLQARQRAFRFTARQRLFRYQSQEAPLVQMFAKEPTESYHLAIDFGGRLPANTSLSSGTLTAIDLTTGDDETATVLDSATAQIQGTDAVFTPQAGEHGHDYLLTLTATLSTGLDLVENLRMQVRSRL